MKKKNPKRKGWHSLKIIAQQPLRYSTVPAPETDKEGRSGNFLGRLFGKKNKGEKSSGDSMAKGQTNASTIKVTTVEKTRDADSAISSKKPADDQSKTEVEKLRKAQEKEERTSTQRFVGKLFGKKNKKAVELSEPPASSLKVTTVEKNSSTESRDKNKSFVTNSDCRDFASEYDVDKLRVRMLGEKTPTDR